LRDAGHGLGDGAAAAAGVEYAVLVFDERENREQTGAAKRGHAEVFGLKRKREADARLLEIAAELGIQRTMGRSNGRSCA